MKEINQTYWQNKEDAKLAGVIDTAILKSEESVAHIDLGKRYILDDGKIMVEGHDFLIVGDNQMENAIIPEGSMNFWDRDHEILNFEIYAVVKTSGVSATGLITTTYRSWQALYDVRNNRLQIARCYETKKGEYDEVYEPTSEELPALLLRIKSAYLLASKINPELADADIIALFS